MEKALPTTDQIKVNIYPSEGGWLVSYENQASEGRLFKDANEALDSAREVFNKLNRDPIIVIHCTRNNGMRKSA